MSFIYEVQLGDFSADLEYAFAGLRLNGATIQSKATGDAYDSLRGIPFPSTVGSFSYNHDVQVITQYLSLTTVPSVDEGEVATWTVTRVGRQGDGLFVELSSSAPGVATVGSSALIPHDRDTADFDVTGVSHGVATITARALAYADVSASITVTEPPLLLSLTGPNSVNEGDTTVWSVTRHGSVSNSLTVTLDSSNPGVALPDAAVVILPNEAAATFTVAGVSDGNATITAGAPGYADEMRPIAVHNVLLNLTLSGAGSVDEGSTVLWTVSRSGLTTGQLVVNLASSAPAIASVAASVLVPAGHSNAQFEVAGEDGDGAVTITASAPGFSSAVRSIDVHNLAPTVDLAAPGSGLVCADLIFSCAASDPGGDQVTATWYFGDATTNVGALPAPSVTQHRYLADGDFIGHCTVSDGDGGIVSQSFNITIGPAFTLTVQVLPVGYDGLLGVGSGTFSLQPPSTACNTYAPGQIVTIMPMPDPSAPRSFMYEWGGDLMAPEQASATNGLTVTMNRDRIITMLLSREFLPGDGVGDLDGDHLHDGWEQAFGLDSKDALSGNGNGGNPDEDLLPGQPDNYAYTHPPANLANGFVPSPNDQYINFIEEAGFDGVLFSADDPGTDPTDPDTDGDGLQDGWEYFFWGNAMNDLGMVGWSYDPLGAVISNQIGNAAILNTFDPLVANGAANADLDNDELSCVEELALGTDPIHWDTDGDGHSDGAEIRAWTDPLSTVSLPGPHVNLLLPANGGVLDSFTSQFSPGFWGASAVHDGRHDNQLFCWASALSPGAQSFDFSFSDGHTAVVQNVVLYNQSWHAPLFDLLPELLYLSSYSRKVEIWVSADGVSYQKAAEAVLDPHLRAQEIKIGDLQARKIRLIVRSGHNSLMWQLGEFEAWGYLLDNAKGGGAKLMLPGSVSGADPAPDGVPLRIQAVDLTAERGFVVHWRSQPGLTYAVEFTTNLKQNFTPVATGIPAVLPSNSFTDRVDRAPCGFHRIRVEE